MMCLCEKNPSDSFIPKKPCGKTQRARTGFDPQTPGLQAMRTDQRDDIAIAAVHDLLEHCDRAVNFHIAPPLFTSTSSSSSLPNQETEFICDPSIQVSGCCTAPNSYYILRKHYLCVCRRFSRIIVKAGLLLKCENEYNVDV